MDKQELKESVLVNLRSVTQSVKGGVPLTRLERDYRDLLGNSIPYRELGFNSLESFIRDIPSCIRLQRGANGSLMAEAVADSSTAHIASLVSRQKQTKARPPSRKRYVMPRRGGYTSRYHYKGPRTSPSSSNTYNQPSARARTFDTRPPFYNSYPAPKSPDSVPKAKDYKPPAKSNDTKSVTTTSQSRPPTRTYELAPRFRRLEELKRKAEEQKNRFEKPENQSMPVLSPEFSRQSPSPSPGPSSLDEFAIPIRAPTSVRPDRSSLSSDLSSNAVYNFSKSSGITNENGFPNSYVQKNPPRPLMSSNRQLEFARSAKEYVEIYAKMNNISIEYSSSTIGQKDRGFVANIKFNGKIKARSYPETAKSPEAAEEIAAKKAVEHIKNERAKLPVTPNNSVEEIQLLLSRIEELVCEKPSGMFTDGILHEYENKFNESLPEHWIDLLSENPVLEIDQVDERCGRVPEGANLIVKPVTGFSSGSSTPSESSGKNYIESQDETEFGITSPRENYVYPPVPPLIIPDGNQWGVYVTNISNFVSARLVDYDDDFLDLSNRMSSFYETQVLPVHEVHEKQLYATLEDPVEGILIVHRIFVINVYEEEVYCYYVDEGTFAEINKSKLQELCEDFLSVPYQALHFAFNELDDYEPHIRHEHLQILLNKTFIAIVKSFVTLEEFLPEDPGLHRVIYYVELYDTSDPENDVCLNTTIKNLVLQSLECKLPKLGTSSPGYLTHITELGEIYLRFLHQDKNWLEKKLENLSKEFEEGCLQSGLPFDNICAAKFEDGKWYRAVVNQNPYASPNSNEVDVLFIDYGNQSKVQRSEICDLQLHSEFLSCLGCQAIKCELFGALPSPDFKWTLAATEKLKKLAPINEELIIRVIGEEKEELPKVKLYRRIHTDDDSIIVSINESIANEQLFGDASVSSSEPIKAPIDLNLKLKTTQGSFANYIPPSPFEALVSPFNNMNVASPANDGIAWPSTPDNIKSPLEEEESAVLLSFPQVPEEGEIFDVFVTLAPNPGNFIVQPLKSAIQLSELMKQMRLFYSTEENVIEMHPSMLKKHCFYAALHSDSTWYRVRLALINDKEANTATVYFVDYGDYAEVPLQNLQELYKQFRTLPCQAIQARIANLRPIEADWNPMHCIQFKEMITEKKFVSIIQRKELKTYADCPYLDLDLTLIDTSDPKKDVYIHELLIEQRMALLKT